MVHDQRFAERCRPHGRGAIMDDEAGPCSEDALAVADQALERLHHEDDHNQGL